MSRLSDQKSLQLKEMEELKQHKDKLTEETRHLAEQYEDLMEKNEETTSRLVHPAFISSSEYRAFHLLYCSLYMPCTYFTFDRMERLMSRVQSKIEGMSIAEQEFSELLDDRQKELKDLESRLKQVGISN